MDQDDLEQYESEDRPQPPKTIQEQFDCFMEAFPWIEGDVVRMLYEARSRGLPRYSVHAILEVIRWHYVTSDGENDRSGFKINRNVGSRLARKILVDHPDLVKFIEIRRLRSE